MPVQRRVGMTVKCGPVGHVAGLARIVADQHHGGVKDG